MFFRHRVIAHLSFAALALAQLPGRPAMAQSHKRVMPIRVASLPVRPDQTIDTELRAAVERAPKQSQWPEENYASLLDTADVTVKPDGTLVGEYRLAYKLFNERGRELAEVSLPFNDGYQKVEVISARTIRKNGSILCVKPEDVRTQSPFSEYLMYDDSKTVGFSMPGVEDDCVIDYRWRLTSRPFIPGQFSESWTFSQSYPVGLSRLVLHAPATRTFQYHVYNNDKVKPAIKTSADGSTKTYVWEMRDIAPLPQEPDMPEMADVTCWMELSSIRDWQEMARWYTGLLKPQAVADASLRKTVQDLIAGKKTDEEKARALYDYAANRVRYVGLEFGISAFKPHAAAAVHEKLYGDCKDKATLLVTMLDIAGIKAYPALLNAETDRSTRSQLPTLEAFDHCIAVAEIGGRDIWLDATAEACEFGDIPSGDRGCDALVIKNGAGEFRTIPKFTADENAVSSSSVITLRPDRSGAMDIEITFHGSSAQEWRSYARTLTPDKRRQMVMRMVPAGGTLKDYAMPDGMTKSGPFVLKLKLEIPRIAKKAGSLVLLGMPTMVGSTQRNPYSKDQRTWPILHREHAATHAITTIALPDGYTIEEMPDAIDISGPLSAYRCQSTRSTDGRTVTVTVDKETRAGTIPPTDYDKMRSYYDRMIEAAEDQMIVLRKAS